MCVCVCVAFFSFHSFLPRIRVQQNSSVFFRLLTSEKMDLQNVAVTSDKLQIVRSEHLWTGHKWAVSKSVAFGDCVCVEQATGRTGSFCIADNVGQSVEVSVQVYGRLLLLLLLLLLCSFKRCWSMIYYWERDASYQGVSLHSWSFLSRSVRAPRSRRFG